MTIWKRVSTAGAAAALVIGTSMLLPQNADARGRGGRGGFHGGGFRGGVGVYGGAYLDPFFGFGWGPYGWPYYGPYGSPYGYGNGYESRANLNAAMIAGYGAIDLKVKPNRAEVWVDGTYYGEARDLDGSPTYLWLAEGAHHLKVAKGGYTTFAAKIDVRRGAIRELKIRMVEGRAEEPKNEPGTSS
jgi:hypothetical protein